MNIEIGEVYISQDSLDCFFFYSTNKKGDEVYGFKVVFWEDGMITYENTSYDVNNFSEETDYVNSSKYFLISKLLSY